MLKVILSCEHRKINTSSEYIMFIIILIEDTYDIFLVLRYFIKLTLRFRSMHQLILYL